MGNKYPTGQSPLYPPKDWVCPIKGCSKYHSKPHFAHLGQIDYSKKPLEEGRVVFNREGTCETSSTKESLKPDTTRRYDLENKTGPSTITIDGKEFPAPLFCPHCGWEEEMVYIQKITNRPFKKISWHKIVSHSCSISGCTKCANYTNGEKSLCERHYTELKQWGLI